MCSSYLKDVSKTPNFVVPPEKITAQINKRKVSQLPKKKAPTKNSAFTVTTSGACI
jgi:hypothetical protein